MTRVTKHTLKLPGASTLTRARVLSVCNAALHGSSKRASDALSSADVFGAKPA